MVVLNSDGSFQYSANSGFVGEDSFVIQAFDGQFASTPVTVTILVTLPPVNPDNSMGGNRDADSNANASSTIETTKSSNNATSTNTASETTNASETGALPQDNSNIAERSMVAQQSAEKGSQEVAGVAALEEAAQGASESQTALLQLSGINWNPLTVSAFQLRDAGQEESRLVARRISESIMFQQSDTSIPDQVEGQDYSSLVEPAKWTVISTGVVIWAVRLGHIITTFASTASAWVYFDPLTVIQSVKEKTALMIT